MSKHEEQTAYSYNYEETAFSIIPTASYYIPTNFIIRPFVQVGIGYLSKKVGIGHLSYKEYESYSGILLGAGIGVATFVNEHISIDVGAQYLYSDLYGYATNNFGGMVGFSVYF